MYIVTTVYKEGKRIHLIVNEETNNAINEFFISHKRAKKACDALNRELKKQERR